MRTMRIAATAIAMVLLAGLMPVARASDACSDVSIRAAADVSVSDGTSFRIESKFHTADHSAIQHFYEDRENQVVAVEGPLGWVSSGGESQLGTNFHKLFALGHQYHAFLVYPEDVLANIRATDSVEFGEANYSATSGDYPYGGTVHRIHGDSPDHPLGLVFDFGDTARIEVTLSDWRPVGDIELPFVALIDDGERVFEYRYTSVDIEPQSPLWYFEALVAPAIDAVQVHRLHRKLLAAHCLGDAGLMGDLSAPMIVSANRGELTQTDNANVITRFAALFENLDYREYEDLAEPVIEVSGDVGWIAVNVRAAGVVRSTADPFDDQWAWIMTVRKIDGVWLHAGNASSVKQ